MIKILLISPDPKLGQLYHDLSVLKQVEIVSVDSVATGVLFLVLEEFSFAIIYPDDELSETRAFLSIRKEYKRWARARVVLVTSDVDRCEVLLMKKDMLVNPDDVLPVEIVDMILPRGYNRH